MSRGMGAPQLAAIRRQLSDDTSLRQEFGENWAFGSDSRGANRGRWLEAPCGVIRSWMQGSAFRSELPRRCLPVASASPGQAAGERGARKTGDCTDDAAAPVQSPRSIRRSARRGERRIERACGRWIRHAGRRQIRRGRGCRIFRRVSDHPVGRIGAGAHASCGDLLEPNRVPGDRGCTPGAVDAGYGASEGRHLDRRVGIAPAFATDLGGYRQRAVRAVVCSTRGRVAAVSIVVVMHPNHASKPHATRPIALCYRGCSCVGGGVWFRDRDLGC
jgi:hypothetical protein